MISIASLHVRLFGFLSLFTSVSTLFCCALPALLVSLGMGMTLASLASTMPWIFQLSHYKAYLFVACGLFLITGFGMVYLTSNRMTCEDGSSCEIAGKYTRATLWISLILYCIGVFMSYLYLPIIIFFES